MPGDGDQHAIAGHERAVTADVTGDVAGGVPEPELPQLPRSVEGDVAAGAVAGLLDSKASAEEVEEVVSFVAAVPLGVRRTAPRWVAPFFLAGAIAIVPWVVYLGLELPDRSTAQHYNLAWVGFDLLLIFAMARTALFAWKGKRQVQLPAVATATLLLVDAWFDVMTAAPGWPLMEALLFAFFLELPMAATAFYIARHVDRVVERAEHRLAEQAQRLLSTHLLAAVADEPAAPRELSGLRLGLVSGHRRVILLAPAVLDRCSGQRQRRGRHRQVAVRAVERGDEVLGHQVEREGRRRVVAALDHGPLLLDGPAERAGLEGVQDDGAVQGQIRGQFQRLADPGSGDAETHVDRRLERVAGAGRPEVADALRIAPQLEQRAGVRDIGVTAADQDAQRSLAGRSERADHGRVDVPEPALARLRGQPPGSFGAGRRGVDDEGARPGGVTDVVQHLLDTLAAEKHEHDDVGRADGVRGAGGLDGAAFEQLSGAARRAVPDGQLVAGVEKVGGEQPSHPSHPEKSDIHVLALPLALPHLSPRRHTTSAECSLMAATPTGSTDGYAMRVPLGEADSSTVLTPEALRFLVALQREFGRARRDLLAARVAQQAELDAGGSLDFAPGSRAIRHDPTWHVRPAPTDLRDRRCEITGPTDARMLINALNSGARVFMADFEDATAPAWSNLIEGQQNLTQAIRRELTLTTAQKTYALGDTVATLVVRPRGWHLPEKHLLVGGEPMSASLFDAGLYAFRNAVELLERGSGPYFYLPKLQAASEAALWADVFAFTEQWLQIPRGSIRATVLVETLPMAFQMEETLHALGPHASGLNAGRWDYMFSAIKTFRARPAEMLLPDRNAVTMTAPFMRAYTSLLVDTCHRRGAHAIGGMAAFIPSRRDPEVNAVALEKVKADKVREAGDGFDGSWVAHPDLVPVCTDVFDGVLGDRPNQLDKPLAPISVTAAELTAIGDTPGEQTEQGLADDIRVGLHYIAAWLGGRGAVAISNLMEDAATAEIARSQVWQWVQAKVFPAEQVRELIDEQAKLLAETGELPRLAAAKALFTAVALDVPLADFLTLPGYELLE